MFNKLKTVVFNQFALWSTNCTIAIFLENWFGLISKSNRWISKLFLSFQTKRFLFRENPTVGSSGTSIWSYGSKFANCRSATSSILTIFKFLIIDVRFTSKLFYNSYKISKTQIQVNIYHIQLHIQLFN